jgi:hypothetical protein
LDSFLSVNYENQDKTKATKAHYADRQSRQDN